MAFCPHPNIEKVNFSSDALSSEISWDPQVYLLTLKDTIKKMFRLLQSPASFFTAISASSGTQCDLHDQVTRVQSKLSLTGIIIAGEAVSAVTLVPLSFLRMLDPELF